MNMVRSGAGLATMVLAGSMMLGTAAAAQVSAFSCKMSNYGRGYGNSDEMFLQLDESRNIAVVYDGLIHNYHDKKPIVERYTKSGNGRYEIHYGLDMKFKGNLSSRADFAVRYFADRREILVSVNYAGADNQGMGGRGKCQPTKAVPAG